MPHLCAGARALRKVTVRCAIANNIFAKLSINFIQPCKKTTMQRASVGILIRGINGISTVTYKCV
jgi:hypothetical protein